MLVCDLPAARKIGAMASCRHQWFCSRCLYILPPFEGGAGNRVGYNDYNMESWVNRTGSQCREWAELYRTAKTEQDARARFDKTGLRWTEFFRLPYFDLPRMLVVDSMHNLFLG
ncbi:hypothetical protein C8F04DRAFT_957808, partial [Mycena alexandri]